MNSKHLKSAPVLLGAVVCATSAWAVPTMTIMDGNPADTVVITDGGALDINAGAGAVSYIGRVGSWFMTVDTGLSKPAIGSALNPSLDLSFEADSKGGGGTLRIIFSDDFFGPIVGGVANATLGGTTGGSTTAAAYYNPDNSISGETTQIGSQMGPYTGGAFSSSQNLDVALNYPYSLTLEVDITHPDDPTQKVTSSGDLQLNLTAVPDGGVTMAMLGFGFVCVEGLRRRFFRL